MKSRKNKLQVFWNSVFGNTQKRYEARHDILTGITARMGFRLYNRNLAWTGDEEFKKIWKNFPETVPYIHERKFTLYYIAKSLRNIPGDIAECGVFRAGSAYLMLAASGGTEKNYHGFDSFEGLSKPGANDSVSNNHSFRWAQHDMSVGENIAYHNLVSFGSKVTLHKGWIPARFPDVADKKFSLVHIDVDLYQPTKDSLEFFWPRLSPGGMIVCDDYGSEACPGAKKAMDEFFSNHAMTVIHLTTGQGIIYKS